MQRILHYLFFSVQIHHKKKKSTPENATVFRYRVTTRESQEIEKNVSDKIYSR